MNDESDESLIGQGIKEAWTTQEPFLEALTELLPVCLFAKDLEGRYVYVNDAFAESISHAGKSAIIGKKPAEVLSPEHAAIAEKEDRHILETGKPILNRENQNTDWYQNKSYVIASKICVRDKQGKKLGIAGITIDITKRKEDENQLFELNNKLEEQNRRYEEELSLGREVQKAFVNVKKPSAHEPLDIGYKYVPSAKLSGDLIVSEPLDEHRWSILICDVMGHGIRSALITGIIRGFYDEQKHASPKPEDLVTKLNQYYSSVLGGMNRLLFTTLSYGILDKRNGELTITCAGHHDPLWFRTSEDRFITSKERILTPEPAVGLIKEHPYTSKVLQLVEGDELMFYTDGLTECQTIQGGEYGIEPIRDQMERHKNAESAAVVASVIFQVKKFAKHIDDDLSLLLIKYGKEQTE